MADEKDARIDELSRMVEVFSRHIDRLKEVLAAEQERNKALDAENSGWLIVYQTLLSQIGVLEAELSRFRSET
jgi:hypothetical protein